AWSARTWPWPLRVPPPSPRNRLLRSRFRGGPGPVIPWFAGLFSVRLCDDFFGDLGRNFGVRIELHGVARPALRPRPQVTDVAEHLCERHQRLDDARTGALVHGLDLPATTVEVADHVTHELLRSRDLDGHHRLHDHRVRLT